jgi:hypothetical protein
VASELLCNGFVFVSSVNQSLTHGTDHQGVLVVNKAATRKVIVLAVNCFPTANRSRRTSCLHLPLPKTLGLVDPQTASKPIADAFALLPVIKVFRAMANAETLYPHFSSYLLRLFKPMELDATTERMIVLNIIFSMRFRAYTKSSHRGP